MSSVPEEVRCWVGHHFNNSLMGLFFFLDLLEQGSFNKEKDLPRLEGILKHMADDIRVVTGPLGTGNPDSSCN